MSSVALIPSSPTIFILSSLAPALLLILLLLLTNYINLLGFALFRRKLSGRNIYNLPPGSFGWPIIGESVEFFGACSEGSPERFFKERVEKYGSVFKTSLVGERVAVLLGPAGHKFLFSNEDKTVNVWWPTSVRRLLGAHSLPSSVGDDAKQIRKMLSYFVSPDALLRLYSKTIHFVAHKHILTHWQGQEEVIVFPTINSYTFELACRLFLSLEDGEFIAKLRVQFDIMLKGIISNPLNFPGTKFYKALRARRAIDKELIKILRKRREELENGTASPSQDLLSHLLISSKDYGKFGTEPVIINNIITLLFAAHDTSTAAITWLIKYLAEHPQVYENVLKEQNEVGSLKHETDFLQWEDIQKMKYSWNVVCEVLRLLPSGTGIFREALVDINYAGYHIPKGWKLYWSASFAHRDPDAFPEPTKFDPSRFEGEGPIPYTYVPFGGGPRMCIGKEFGRVVILTFLHNLIRRFRWNLLIPDEKIQFDPTPIPLNGLPVRLQPHQNYPN